MSRRSWRLHGYDIDEQETSPRYRRFQQEEAQSQEKRRQTKIRRNLLPPVTSQGDGILPNIHGPRTSQLPVNWTPPPQPANAKPIFQPVYFGGQDKLGDAINAIIEIRTTWAYVIQEAYYNYRDIYSKLSIPLKKSVIQICQEHKEEFAVYDREKNMWLIEPNELDYNYCYDGENFSNFEETKNKTTANRILLVGKYTILRQEPKLLKGTSTTDFAFKRFSLPSSSLTVGVPGCGKTTYIVKNHVYGSLVLTSCAAGAQDIRKRMAEIYDGDPNSYKNSYRTIDSYLINSRRQFLRVWVDEALMEHPGKLFLVCLFSRCSALFLLGDPNQLPYINRLGVKLRFDKSSMFFKPTKTLNVSYRCPVDVMGVLSNTWSYDGGAYSASKVLHSLKCDVFTSLKDIPKSEDTKYLVFKQSEKKLMAKAGYDVSTIHEFQGKEAASEDVMQLAGTTLPV